MQKEGRPSLSCSILNPQCPEHGLTQGSTQELFVEGMKRPWTARRTYWRLFCTVHTPALHWSLISFWPRQQSLCFLAPCTGPSRSSCCLQFQHQLPQQLFIQYIQVMTNCLQHWHTAPISCPVQLKYILLPLCPYQELSPDQRPSLPCSHHTNAHFSD